MQVLKMKIIKTKLLVRFQYIDIPYMTDKVIITTCSDKNVTQSVFTCPV